MSTYLKENKGLEYDNSPTWLIAYMEHRYSIVGDTQETIMTYFKTLREFFQWFSYSVEAGRSPTEKELRNTDISPLDITCIDDISRDTIEHYLYYITDTLQNQAATRGKKLVTLRSFFEYVIEHADKLHLILTSNPTARIPMPKGGHKQPLYLSGDEQSSLLSAVAGPNSVRDYAMILIFLSTGIRISEIVKLNVADVRRDKMLLRIRGGKGRKDRNVPLTQPCLDAINAYLEEYRNLASERLDTDALFISQRRLNRLTTKAVEKALHGHFLRAGLSDITVHKLRHSAATSLVKDGIDLPIIQKVLGHASADTTGIYIHLSDSDVKKALRNSSIHELGATHSSFPRENP